MWNGETDVRALDALATAGYRGHIGSRGRDLTGLKAEFGEGDFLATRLTAHAKDAVSAARLTACGTNISRWEGELLAEEWAVWESLIESPG